MKNLKDSILEKLKVSSKSSITFDDIVPCDFSEDLFIETSHILYKNGYKNVYEYYDLKNIYDDNLPGFYRSVSFCDENSKCIGIYGDFESKDPKIRLIFIGHDNKPYSSMFSMTSYDFLALSLGKGDINKGLGVLKYILNMLK